MQLYTVHTETGEFIMIVPASILDRFFRIGKEAIARVDAAQGAPVVLFGNGRHENLSVTLHQATRYEREPS